MYSEILESVITKKDLDLLWQEVDILLASSYKEGKENFDSALKEKVRYTTASLIKDELNKIDLNKVDYLKGLHQCLTKFSLLKLTLAREPSERSLLTIIDWARNNISINIVIDINIDESIISGAIIIFQGKYKDFSLRKRFAETIAKKFSLNN